MDKTLNEIRKLRKEMRVALIGLENQNETSSSPIEQQIIGPNKMIINALINFLDSIERRFVSLEYILDNDINEIRSEINGIKKRLDQSSL